MTEQNKQSEKQCDIHVVISRFFADMAKKYNVKVEDLNLHIHLNTLYIQEYTPGSKTEYKCLEMVDLNGL